MSKRVNNAVQQSTILSERAPALPSFLQKLWVILNTHGCESVIRWDESGQSFHIVDSHLFCKEVLPNFFKHNNLNSFVRQLNLYGFRKVSAINGKSYADSSDNLHFANPYFIRGHYNLMHKIKRAVGTKQKPDPTTGTKTTPSQGKVVTLPEEDLICLLQELKIVRERQTSMRSTMTQLTRDNILLWQEMAALRNSYDKQQKNVGKLVQFLMGLGQQHQKRMPHNSQGQQRIVQLEEIDNVMSSQQHLSQNYTQPQANNSNCLALQQNPSSAKLPILDCDILDGIQQELSESVTSHSSPMSLNVETALLEGLQLRARAIEEGAPYLQDSLLSSDHQQYPGAVETSGPLTDQRLRHYENLTGIHLKRPFQRRMLSPGSPSEQLYPKRALYTTTNPSSNKQQDLVPASSSGRSRLTAYRGDVANSQHSIAHQSAMAVEETSPEAQNEEGETHYYMEDQDGNLHQLMYEEDAEDGEYSNDYEGEEFAAPTAQTGYFTGQDEELMLMNEDLDEDEEQEEEEDVSYIKVPQTQMKIVKRAM